MRSPLVSWPVQTKEKELQRCLREEHRIEVPYFDWTGRPLIRVSIQGYNTKDDIERLGAAPRQSLRDLAGAVC